MEKFREKFKQVDKKKKIITLALITIVVVLAHFLIKEIRKDKDHITLYGNIEIRTVDMGFRVEGIIKNLFFEEGDMVKKGDVLATLDDTNYAATYEKSLAEINRTAAISNNASEKHKRNIPLCADETVSRQDCDDLTYNKLSAQAAHQAAEAESDLAKKNLNDTKIVAQEEGIIMTRAQENGASIMPTQIVYVMAKTKPVWVRAYVNEKDLGNLEYGAKAKIYTDSINPSTGKKREYEGYVGYISPVAEFTPKTVQTTDIRTDLVYRIRVYIDVSDSLLRQGMPVTAVINIKNKTKNDGNDGYIDAKN